MKTAKKTKEIKPVQGFFLHADGQRFGPYRSRYEDRVSKLLHLKGIRIEYVMMVPQLLLPPPRPKRPKPENMRLF
jgi:hypothetical protein